MHIVCFIARIVIYYKVFGPTCEAESKFPHLWTIKTIVIIIIIVSASHMLYGVKPGSSAFILAL